VLAGKVLFPQRMERPMSEPHDSASETTAAVTEENVRTIAELERAAIRRRTLTERLSDNFTRIMGSLTFVSLHVVGLLAWFSINLGLVPGLHPFDPFPFGILTLIVSTEGVLLAIFVLISQNRMSRQANQRAHLNLQISLLAEQETTKLLQEVRRIAERLGIDRREDEEARRLSQHTHLETLAAKLEQSLPDE
jgi:uncharacterized membrane protein